MRSGLGICAERSISVLVITVQEIASEYKNLSQI